MVHYVTAENDWYFLQNFETRHPPNASVEWIIIAPENFHVKLYVTWLECDRCSKALEVKYCIPTAQKWVIL